MLIDNFINIEITLGTNIRTIIDTRDCQTKHSFLIFYACCDIMPDVASPHLYRKNKKNINKLSNRNFRKQIKEITSIFCS